MHQKRILGRNKNWSTNRILRHRKTRNSTSRFLNITENFIKETLENFREIDQKPPVFSAIKNRWK